MPLPPPKEYTAQGTYFHLSEPRVLAKFLQEYRNILTRKLKKITISGGGEYWTCGQDHDPRNWNWRPWKFLDSLCRKYGLDTFAAKDVIQEHLGRKCECECQVLYDEREIRKEALRRQFGLDVDSVELL